MNLIDKELANMEVISSYRESFMAVKRWLENRNANKTFADYFHRYGYKTIAIYGAGDLGRLLYEEIKNSDIKVKYFIDRNGEGIHEIDGIPVTTISSAGEMEEVDILVVTFLNTYDKMCETLARYAPEIRTLSLKEALYEV
ncbi:MAG: hypothetical protein HFG49_03175 [Lachnospiraceae bacterium]|nr:hypothetical protein [Lachnospiraceae bacterium]